MKKQTFGVIVSTRSFFPSHLVGTARKAIAEKLDSLGFGYVMVSEDETNYGAVLSYEEAKTCARLFKAHAGDIDGILVILPNFSEELGVAEAIELSGLHVPIMIQACDDEFDKLDMSNRRDAFCGKISLCNNLYQRGIPYTLTSRHTCRIDSQVFTDDLMRFAGVCRVVNGLRGARIAMLGARPLPFATVRFSEKILQAHGIGVQTVDMSEVIFDAKNREKDEEHEAKKREILNYGTVAPDIGEELLDRQASLCLAIEKKVRELECDALTVQCWDSVENNYGCATCLAMSMLGEAGIPAACESDVTGAVSMLAAGLAAGSPPALMDWNNNIDDEEDACVCLHCSNFPKSFFAGGEMEIECLDVLGSTLGKANCFGACKGQTAAGPMTYVRFTTDDCKGRLKMYVGEGEFSSAKVPTKGGLANCHVPNLQSLLRYICENGFEHHVCFVHGHVADILQEAAKYIGADCYRHR